MSSIFISHATEDKNAVARPLAEALKDRGYDVWFDEFSLKLGDSLRRGIDAGLAKCSFGIVILSKSFFAKEWPQKELDALNARETSSREKLILPVWHDVSAEEVARFSPTLADRLGVSTSKGLMPVIVQITDVIGAPQKPRVDSQAEENAVFSFGDRNVLQWRECVGQLFPQGKLSSAKWTDIADIVSVLQKVSLPNLNHTFFPEGGGMDLIGCEESLEAGCIELIWSRRSASVAKPLSLAYENFPGFSSLSYFRLELQQLNPWSDGIDIGKYRHEELAEIYPMDYRERLVVNAGYYDHDENGDEIAVPMDSRVITRHFNGSFVIFAKGSLYNNLKGKHDAYYGQHDKMGAEAFRKFVSDIIHAATVKDLELEPDRKK